MPEEPFRPFVQVATICQNVLQERDGTLSLIRILDNIEVPPSDVYGDKALVQNITAVVVLRCGSLQGDYDLKIVPHCPRGHVVSTAPIKASFKGQEQEVRIVKPLTFVADVEGLYWFQVSLGNDLLSCIPLKVSFKSVPKSIELASGAGIDKSKQESDKSPARAHSLLTAAARSY